MTLDFGIRAQLVKTKPVSTEEMSAEMMRHQIKILKQENFDLRVIIEEFKHNGDK